MEENKKSLNNDFFKNLKLTYKYAKSGKKYLFLFLIANIILTIISIVIPYLTAKRLVSVTSSLWNRLLFLIIIMFAVFANLDISSIDAPVTIRIFVNDSFKLYLLLKYLEI